MKFFLSSFLLFTLISCLNINPPTYVIKEGTLLGVTIKLAQLEIQFDQKVFFLRPQDCDYGFCPHSDPSGCPPCDYSDPEICSFNVSSTNSSCLCDQSLCDNHLWEKLLPGQSSKDYLLSTDQTLNFRFQVGDCYGIRISTTISYGGTIFDISRVRPPDTTFEIEWPSYDYEFVICPRDFFFQFGTYFLRVRGLDPVNRMSVTFDTFPIEDPNLEQQMPPECTDSLSFLHRYCLPVKSMIWGPFQSNAGSFTDLIWNVSECTLFTITYTLVKGQPLVQGGPDYSGQVLTYFASQLWPIRNANNQLSAARNPRTFYVCPSESTQFAIFVG